MRESRIEPSLREIVAAAKARRKFASLRPIDLRAEPRNLEVGGGFSEGGNLRRESTAAKGFGRGTVTWGDIP
jgi:hypothetical protein